MDTHGQSSINTSVGRYDEAGSEGGKPIIWAWGIMPEMALVWPQRDL